MKKSSLNCNLLLVYFDEFFISFLNVWKRWIYLHIGHHWPEFQSILGRIFRNCLLRCCADRADHIFWRRLYIHCAHYTCNLNISQGKKNRNESFVRFRNNMVLWSSLSFFMTPQPRRSLRDLTWSKKTKSSWLNRKLLS